jgi:hypothetical protein
MGLKLASAFKRSTIILPLANAFLQFTYANEHENKLRLKQNRALFQRLYLATRCDLSGISPLTRHVWRIIRPFPLSRTPASAFFLLHRENIAETPFFPQKLPFYPNG